MRRELILPSVERPQCPERCLLEHCGTAAVLNSSENILACVLHGQAASKRASQGARRASGNLGMQLLLV